MTDILIGVSGSFIMCSIVLGIAANVFYNTYEEYFINPDFFDERKMYELFKNDVKASEKIEKMFTWLKDYKPHVNYWHFIWKSTLINSGLPLLIVAIGKFVEASTKEYTTFFAILFLLALLAGIFKISKPFRNAKRYFDHYKRSTQNI